MQDAVQLCMQSTLLESGWTLDNLDQAKLRSCCFGSLIKGYEYIMPTSKQLLFCVEGLRFAAHQG